jgi:putative FmdB family regulatory protein
MPLYEYDCAECQQRFEILQKMSDPDLTKYPECSNSNCCLQKVPSACGLQFIGSGFYKNDYK